MTTLFSNFGFIFSGLFGLTAIILGAYGSHGLKNLSAHDMLSWQTAVNYQLFHSLLIFGLSNLKDFGFWSKLGLIFTTLGIILFSGSIFTKILFQGKLEFISNLSKLAPYGGMCFMIAWTCLIIFGFKKF